MLPKSKRLTTKEIECLSSGKSVFGTLISMRFIKGDTLKVAVSISKKVAPLAVDRNRMRRKLYNLLPTLIGGVKVPVYFMLMPKKELFSSSDESIRAEIAAVFKKAGLI